MKLTLYDFLRIGHIKRWHNVNTVRQQTVAEHSYLVMLIALELFNHIVGVEWAEGERGNARMTLRLLIGAMFHDAPEAASGDTPTPAKRLLREVTGDPELFDKVEERLMPALPYLGCRLPLDEERFIKMADAIEGYHWILDNGAGTHAEIVKMASRRRLEDLVLKYDTDEPTMNWYEAVNHVLVAMGVPYVHKESRISPP